MTDDSGETSPAEDDPTDDVADETSGNVDDETGACPCGGESVQVYELDANEPISTGVVMAVAAVTGRSTESFEPLFETIDTDALDSLVGPAGSTQVSVTFTYAGTTVTVDSKRHVVVHR